MPGLDDPAANDFARNRVASPEKMDSVDGVDLMDSVDGVDLMDSEDEQPSPQQRLDHLAMHIREAKIASLEAIDQASVVDAQQVQERGIQVMHMHRITRDVVAASHMVKQRPWWSRP